MFEKSKKEQSLSQNPPHETVIGKTPSLSPHGGGPAGLNGSHIDAFDMLSTHTKAKKLREMRSEKIEAGQSAYQGEGHSTSCSA